LLLLDAGQQAQACVHRVGFAAFVAPATGCNRSLFYYSLLQCNMPAVVQHYANCEGALRL
jgi:hypothetical protein